MEKEGQVNPSLKISLKKAFREWAAGAILLGATTFGAFLVDPAIVEGLLKAYAPSIPAVLGAQIVSGIARVVIDQIRHRGDVRPAA